MRGVRKEINYSEPCSNAPDKAQFEFGLYPFEHERAQRARVQMGTTQTQLCFILGIWARFGIIYFLIWWISFIFGMMVDIGIKFLSASSPPRGWPWGQGHELRIFHKKVRVKVFALKFIRPHILKTLRWISFIFGLMVDIGLKVLLAPSPPRGWPWGQGHGLRIFIKKSKFFVFKFI